MHSWQGDQSDVSCTGHHNRRHESSFWPSPDDVGFDHLGKVISAYFSDVKLLCLRSELKNNLGEDTLGLRTHATVSH